MPYQSHSSRVSLVMPNLSGYTLGVASEMWFSQINSTLLIAHSSDSFLSVHQSRWDLWRYCHRLLVSSHFRTFLYSTSISMIWMRILSERCCCLGLCIKFPKRSWKHLLFHRYVECTSACIQALAAFQKQYPHHRTQEIASSIFRARKYIESIQKDDGSW